MLSVRFFARLREELGTGQLTVAWTTPLTVAQAVERLVEQGGETWLRALTAENLVIAVNHSVCTRERVLADGDELAFFPPVTGG